MIVGSALSFFLIAQYKLTGAAWSVVARPALTCLLLIPAVISAFPSVPRAIPVIRIAACSILACSAPWALYRFQIAHFHAPTTLTSLAVILLGALIATPLYFGTLVLTEVMTPQELLVLIPGRRR
jgi:hypothetical protein